MNTELTENQTLFSEEQPFFDVNSYAGDPANGDRSKKKSKKSIIIIALVGFMVMVIIALTIMRFFPKNNGGTNLEPSPTPSPSGPLTGLDLLFQELDVEIKKADPTENILPFPPIENNILVTPEKR